MNESKRDKRKTRERQVRARREVKRDRVSERELMQCSDAAHFFMVMPMLMTSQFSPAFTTKPAGSIV